MPVYIVDTGPVVAFLNRRDRYHAWATARLAEIEPPLHTCEAVVSEACFLLRNSPGGCDAVMALIDRGLLSVSLRLPAEQQRIRRLLKRYADVPMSVADACLVRMSELTDNCKVMTLDSDFQVYRRNGRQVIPTLIPGS